MVISQTLTLNMTGAATTATVYGGGGNDSFAVNAVYSATMYGGAGLDSFSGVLTASRVFKVVTTPSLSQLSVPPVLAVF